MFASKYPTFPLEYGFCDQTQRSSSEHQVRSLEPHPHLAPPASSGSWPARSGFCDAPYGTTSCYLLVTVRTGETTDTYLGRDPNEILSPAAGGRRKSELKGLLTLEANDFPVQGI